MLHQLFNTTFDKQVTSRLTKNTYTVFIRVKYDVNCYFMAGNQFGFTYNNANDINNLKSTIIKRLEKYFEDYKLTDDDIIYVEASFWLKDKKLLSEFSLDPKPLHVSKLKLAILDLGGELYYSDTDSIVTNIKLPESWVSSEKLGLLKLEHEIEEAIFISNKIYWLRDKKGLMRTVAKGIRSDSLSYKDFISLYNETSITTAVKTISKRDWDTGSVSIEDKEDITINFDSYTKRTKIYNLSNRWIDTLPLFINTELTALVLYSPKTTALIVYKGINLSNEASNKAPSFIVFKSNISNKLKRLIEIIFIISLMVFAGIAYLCCLDTDNPDLDYSISVEFYDKQRGELNDSKPKNDSDNNADSRPLNNIKIKVSELNTPSLEKYIPCKTEPLTCIQSAIGESQPIGDKTLYEGFKDEISKIQGNKNPTECSSEESPSKNTVFSSSDSSSTTKTSVSIPYDNTKDSSYPFSPNTIEALNNRLKENHISLENLNNTCKDLDTKDTINERLKEERDYLLSSTLDKFDEILSYKSASSI